MRPPFRSGAGALLVLVLAALAAPCMAEPTKPAAPSTAVLELFTSQGCSSCPPADALLAELGKRPGLVTLSYSVDYWNYLGWHDTLASPANSERQREYARMRGDGKVYTPQIVVDGLTHVNGSNEAAIEMAMRSAAIRLKDARVPVNMHAEGDTLVIGIGAAPDNSDKRGGTGGMWKGEAMTLKLPLKDLKTMGGDCLVALLQVENGGPILGAAEYDRP